MICDHAHIDVYARNDRYDPTRTTVLRNMFAADMKKRFKQLTQSIRHAIVEQDLLQIQPYLQFNYSSDEKIKLFLAWLKEQERKGLITVVEYEQIGSAINEAWTNKYIADSYKRGVIRARYELQKAGASVPSIDDTGGIDMVMTSPFHIDRVAVLYTRTFTDLKGITDAMDAQLSRVLAQGMIDGDNPRTIARKLIATINGGGADLGITDTLGRFIPAAQRAEILARTEIIRAHHLAMIQEYRNWKLYNVYVKAEWITAGDERVCDKCSAMQGEIYTLDQVEKMIPAHPQCRCIALPYLDKTDTKGGIDEEE